MNLENETKDKPIKHEKVSNGVAGLTLYHVLLCII